MAERIQKSKTTHEKSETPDTAADAVTSINVRL